MNNFYIAGASAAVLYFDLLNLHSESSTCHVTLSEFITRSWPMSCAHISTNQQSSSQLVIRQHDINYVYLTVLILTFLF